VPDTPPPAPDPGQPVPTPGAAPIPPEQWVVEKPMDSAEYLDRPEPKYEGGPKPG
jgi:hypothetical protein